jgi:CRP-like cAMP-binding protein
MTALPRVIPQDWLRHPFVARLAHYTDLSESDLGTLWNLVENELTIKKRRDLVVDGYEYRRLCFVEDGFAARYKLLRNGRRQVVNVIVPGDVVGMPGSFLEKSAYSVVAITDVKLQYCSIDDYVRLCYQRPQFGLLLSWLAVEEAATYAEHIVDIGRRTPTERLARFLLEIHSRLLRVGRATETTFDLPFSQEVIGDALGLSVPHLNRMLVQLRTDGLITIHERCVEFIDLKAMQVLGQFQPLNLARIPVMDTGPNPEPPVVVARPSARPARSNSRLSNPV